MSDSRERFEAWTQEYELDIAPGFPGQYSDCNTDFAWIAWQAAERAALERAIAMLEADSGEATEWRHERYARYTAEAAEKIRALMEKE